MASLGQRLSLTIVAVFFGFMLVLQFQTIKHPKVKDTRDISQLQSDLAKAQNQHIKLNAELTQSEQLLNKYQSSQKENLVNTMKETLQQQKEQAGLTSKEGTGDLIVIKPLVGGNDPFSNDGIITADLMRSLINVLNEYGAIDIAVGGERIINITPIRMVHNDLLINDQKMPEVPYSVHVLTPDPDKLKTLLDVSPVLDDFARAGLTLSVSIKKQVSLPAYQSPIKFSYVKPVEGGK
ncbi:MAG TPA: DUF881 domain-containing protein [Candidatus Angelobacter sp.]|nr:DUF881 domain-containing protein [Candidatus Angelobacter sp.]